MFNFFELHDNDFSLNNLGDITDGRQNLGSQVPVFVYRLLEYSLKSELAKQFGEQKSEEIFRNAGELAGTQFAKQMLDLTLPLPRFIEHLQTVFSTNCIGIIRFENFDHSTGDITLTISEDLTCSGLPIIGKTVCNYDEGFLKGILDSYTCNQYVVQEIDCWATGSRVCRFQAHILDRK